MEGYKHFSHPHTLSLHQSLEGAKLTCSGCNFPCTGTAVYSCCACKFFLHDQCFNATRSLIHPSHPDHPLSLFPYPTYTSGSFVCKSCNETGSGFCFCCPTCEFDLHVHCVYNNLNPKPTSNPPSNQIILKSYPNHKLKYLHESTYTSSLCLSHSCGTSYDRKGALYRCDNCAYDDAHVGRASLSETVDWEDHENGLPLLYVNPNTTYDLIPKPSSNPPPNQIKLKSHPNHQLKYLYNSAHTSGSTLCDVCGTACDPNGALYSCDICDYDVHVGCTSLSETVHREDHEHALSLLYVNPNSEYECDVCRGVIEQNNCMYLCTSGCDYGTHVKCVSNKVSEEALMGEMTFDFDMSKLLNKMREFVQSYWALAIVMVIIAILILTMRACDNCDNRYYYSQYCDNNRCIIHNRISNRR